MFRPCPANHLIELLGVHACVAIVLLDHLEARPRLAAYKERFRAGGEERRNVGMATVVEGAGADAERTQGRQPILSLGVCVVHRWAARWSESEDPRPCLVYAQVA